jgi:LuxR family maltose regulon positive regulatory protein
MAWALTDTGQMEKMKRFIELAETAGINSDRQACHISAIRANQASMLGDIEQMINYALEAQALIHPEDTEVRGLVTLMLSKGAFWKGNLPRSAELLQDSYSDNLAAGDYNRAVLNLTDAGAIQVVMGNIKDGLNTLQDALDLAGEIKRSSGRRSIASAYTYLTLGDVSIELGELEKASKYIQRGLHLAELWGQPEILMIGYEYLSRALTEAGDFKNAFQANRTALKYAAYKDKHSTWVNNLRAYEIQIYLRQGNIGKASQIIEDLGLDVSDPIEFGRRILIRTLSKYLTYVGQYDPAIQMLAELVDVSKMAGAPIHTMKALILKAVAHHLKGDHEHAFKSLEPALSIAAVEGLLVQAFVTEGEPMAQLLYQASLRGIYPEFCNDLLKRFTPSEEAIAKSQEGLVEPLSQREIEVLVLIAQGCTNQEIAQDLHLSLYTVKSHAHNIYSKLGVKNRTEAVTRAQLLGILTSN